MVIRVTDIDKWCGNIHPRPYARLRVTQSCEANWRRVDALRQATHRQDRRKIIIPTFDCIDINIYSGGVGVTGSRIDAAIAATPSTSVRIPRTAAYAGIFEGKVQQILFCLIGLGCRPRPRPRPGQRPLDNGFYPSVIANSTGLPISAHNAKFS